MPSILEYIQGEADILCYSPRGTDVIAAFKDLQRKDSDEESDGHVECNGEDPELVPLTVPADAASPVSEDKVIQEEDNSCKTVHLDPADSNQSQGNEMMHPKKESLVVRDQESVSTGYIHPEVDSNVDMKQLEDAASCYSALNLLELLQEKWLPRITGSSVPRNANSTWSAALSTEDAVLKTPPRIGDEKPFLASSESSTPCSTIKTSTDSSPSTGFHSTGQILRLVDLKETPERVREILLHSKKGSNYEVESNKWKNPDALLDFQAAGFTLEEQLILKRRLKLQKLARSFHSETEME